MNERQSIALHSFAVTCMLLRHESFSVHPKMYRYKAYPDVFIEPIFYDLLKITLHLKTEIIIMGRFPSRTNVC